MDKSPWDQIGKTNGTSLQKGKESSFLFSVGNLPVVALTRGVWFRDRGHGATDTDVVIIAMRVTLCD